LRLFQNFADRDTICNGQGFIEIEVESACPELQIEIGITNL